MQAVHELMGKKIESDDRKTREQVRKSRMVHGSQGVTIEQIVSFLHFVVIREMKVLDKLERCRKCRKTNEKKFKF